MARKQPVMPKPSKPLNAAGTAPESQATATRQAAQQKPTNLIIVHIFHRYQNPLRLLERFERFARFERFEGYN